MKHWPNTTHIEGFIALVPEPYDYFDIEPTFRKVSALRPLGILYQGGGFSTPGATMFLNCDGKDRRSISVPVAETYGDHWLDMPDGTYVEVYFEENLWKGNLDTRWQVVVGALLSFWTWCNVIFGCFRIWQFYMHDPNFSIFAIGPLCLLLEVIASITRGIVTIVDPFWSARLWPYVALVSPLSTPILFLNH